MGHTNFYDNEFEINNSVQQATSSIDSDWSGPWPTLLITVNLLVRAGLYLFIVIAADILGSVNVQDADMDIDGIQDMPESESQEYIAMIESAESTVFWKDIVNWYSHALLVALGLIQIAAVIPIVVSMSWVAIVLGLFSFAYFMFLFVVIKALRMMEYTDYDVMHIFIEEALTILTFGVVSAVILHFMPLGLMGVLGYFHHNYSKANSIKGYKGRCQVYIVVTMIILFIATILIYNGTGVLY